MIRDLLATCAYSAICLCLHRRCSSLVHSASSQPPNLGVQTPRASYFAIKGHGRNKKTYAMLDGVLHYHEQLVIALNHSARECHKYDG